MYEKIINCRYDIDAIEYSKKATDRANLFFGKKIVEHRDLLLMNDIKDKYDVIILDPPAFAKHQSAKYNALQGYKRINLQAIQQIKKGGIIFTFSCSQVVEKQLFYSTIVSAAILSGRKVKVIHQLSQPPDHPVSAFHPEGEYLKGLVLFVD